MKEFISLFIAYGFVLATVVLLLFAIALFFLSFIENIFLNIFKDRFFNRLPFTRTKAVYRKILLSQFAYYQKLNARDRIKFEKRVVYFIRRNRFYARGMPEVTTEMKVLIASSAVQLTFGLPALYFPLFNRILVYPNDYYSEIYKRYHKGEVNPRHKTIVLSWNNFLEGYESANDGINLGIHEMAHALELENMMINQEYNFLDWEAHKNWIYLARDEMQKIKNGMPHFFRPYAGVNRQEFFAVCMENFFERPEGFKAALPELYLYTARMLNQDPLKGRVERHVAA